MHIQYQGILARRIEVVRLDDEALHLYSIIAAHPVSSRSARHPERCRRTDVNFVHEGVVEMRKPSWLRGFAVGKIDAVDLRRFADAALDVDEATLARIKVGSVNRLVREKAGD